MFQLIRSCADHFVEGYTARSFVSFPDCQYIAYSVSDFSRNQGFDRMCVATPLLGSIDEVTAVPLVSISRRARKSSPLHPRVHGVIK